MISEISESFSNKNLELIILPTEKCNFRCTYCYEDFELGKMTESTINSIKILLSKRIPELNRLRISWFGGEPLLAKSVIFEINKHILNEMELNNPTLKFTSNITTNGFLLNNMLTKELVNLNLKYYQISLDGEKEFHNKTRVKINGGETFDVIWQNLLELKESNLDFNITLRLHITNENYNSSHGFIKKVENTFLFDNRFSLLIKPVGRYGGANDHLINPISDEDEKKLKDYFIKYEDTEENNYVCYASKPNSFVIRSNGNLAKCTVYFNHKANNIGELSNSGELNINTDLAKLWSLGFFNNDKNYLACPMSLIRQNNTATNSGFKKLGI